MVYGQSETDLELDQKRYEVHARLARETRIGWPILMVIAMLIGVGCAIALYLFWGACTGQH